MPKSSKTEATKKTRAKKVATPPRQPSRELGLMGIGKLPPKGEPIRGAKGEPIRGPKGKSLGKMGARPPLGKM